MHWIFRKQQNIESEERKSKRIYEILDRKTSELKELLILSTIGSKIASEEELEYWKAHPNCKGDKVHESKDYRYYSIKNLSESVDWCLIALKEYRDPKEIQENRLKQKKNQ
jgi:hypothetical protein